MMIKVGQRLMIKDDGTTNFMEGTEGREEGGGDLVAMLHAIIVSF